MYSNKPCVGDTRRTSCVNLLTSLANGSETPGRPRSVPYSGVASVASSVFLPAKARSRDQICETKIRIQRQTVQLIGGFDELIGGDGLVIFTICGLHGRCDVRFGRQARRFCGVGTGSTRLLRSRLSPATTMQFGRQNWLTSFTLSCPVVTLSM